MSGSHLTQTQRQTKEYQKFLIPWVECKHILCVYFEDNHTYFLPCVFTFVSAFVFAP